MRRNQMTATLRSLALGVLFACLPLFAATAQSASGETLKIRWYEDLVNLDPVLLQDSLGNEIAYKIYDTLVAIAPGTLDEVVPGLAESWDLSEDGLVYTFHLREGVQWQRGYGTVTAADVRYSFLRHKSDTTASVYKAEAEPIADVEVVDDLTVRVVMSHPYPTFLTEFVAYRPGFIVNEQAITDLGDDYLDSPVGSGPYMLQSWTPFDRVVLVNNPDHRDGVPYFTRLEYIIIPEDTVFEIALQNKEVDIGWMFDPQVQRRALNSDDYSALSMPAQRTIYIQANMTKPTLADERVRQALWYATDRELIVETILLGQGEVSDTVFNPSVFGYLADDIYEYDPDKAAALLDEAGYGDGLSVDLLIQDTYEIPAMAQAIQAMWAEVGVNTTLTLREWPQIVEARRAGNFDLVMGALARAGADQYATYFYDSEASPYPNSSQYISPEADALIREGRVTVGDTERAEVYSELQRLVAVDAPVIPVLTPIFVLAYQSDLDGVELGLLTINAPDISSTQRGSASN